MPEVVHLAEHSPEWHEARRWRVGGSEIGAICGWSPWAGPEGVAERKLSGETSEPTPRQQLGHDAEPMLASWLGRKIGAAVDLKPGTWLDELGIANPDGLVGATGELFEAKTVNDRSKDDGWGRQGTDLVPLYFAAQCIWYCGLTGAPGAHLVALCGALNGRVGLHVAHYYIPANPAAYAHMRSVAAEWRAEHLEGHRP